MTNILRFIILLVCVPMAVPAQFACSGLDRVDIYLNNKLIGTATAADIPVIKLDTLAKPDTLTFHAFTNWEGLRNSTLDVKDDYGELIDHINTNSNSGYEAVFTYVFVYASLDDPGTTILDITLNLFCERTIETEQVATIHIVPK